MFGANTGVDSGVQSVSGFVPPMRNPRLRFRRLNPPSGPTLRTGVSLLTKYVDPFRRVVRSSL